MKRNQEQDSAGNNVHDRSTVSTQEYFREQRQKNRNSFEFTEKIARPRQKKCPIKHKRTEENALRGTHARGMNDRQKQQLK